MVLKTLIIFFYVSGVIATFVVGFEGISKHITWKGFFSTLLISLFSWFTLFYLLGDSSTKNYKDF